MSEDKETIIDLISGKELKATPEETEAVQPFVRKLLEDYGYDKSRIQTHPQWRVKVRPSDKKKEYPIDIAVFNSEDHSDETLYIVVECKKKKAKEGISQLKDYLRFSSARIGVWFNGNETRYFFKTESNGKVDFREIPNIPLFGQRIEDVGLFKRKDLKGTHNLKPVFNSIRNWLAANNTGITLDTEFVGQIISLLFCKIYDERFTLPDDQVQFRAGINESADSIAERIKDIFKKVKNEYKDVFSRDESIKLEDASIAYVVGQLQQYCMMDSERDVIADAFETFITPSLRGGQGQFFTPRNVVRLLLSLVQPTPHDTIIDPACGSGGFLVESLKYVWQQVREEGSNLKWPEREIIARMQEVAIKNFRGIDKESFLSKTSKAYMAILGDGRGGIFCENSLLKPTKWSTNTQSMIALNSFSVVLTNPPYGKGLQIDDKDILKHYELGHKWIEDKKTGKCQKTDTILDKQTPQVLFIERCLNLLRPGGRMGVVTPESMLSNPSHKYIVDFIEKSARIDAIVSMPEDLFQPHTHAKTCVVVITKNSNKKAKSEDHPIFMAVAKWCGHDSRGLPIPKDDLPLIQERFNLYFNNNPLEYNHLGFSVNKKDIKNNIYLPIYYNPEIEQNLDSLKKDYTLKSIKQLVKDKVISIKRGVEVGKQAYGTGNIPFIRTSDIANWEIKLDPKQSISQDIYEKHAKKLDIKDYDILMVKDGTYLVGTCAMILPGETKILYQSHLYKIRSNDHEKLNPYLLLALLSSPIVKQQIRAKQFTQDIIDTLGSRIEELILPFPKDENKVKELISQVQNVFELRSTAKKHMRDVLTDVTPIHNFESDASFFTLI